MLSATHVPFKKVLLTTALLAALAACGGGDDEDKAPDVKPPAEVVAPDTFTPNAGTTGGSSDASTAFAQSEQWMIVADDESNLLRVYPRSGGAAILEWSYTLNGPKFAKELDMEASAKVGSTIYFTGSHSNKKDGDDAMADRSHMFALTTTGVGAATQFTYLGQFAGLETQLVAWDTGNGHGLGANYFGMAVSAGAGIVPERVDGFSIEGMTTSKADTALWLGFRAPLANSAIRNKALIVPVNNYTALIAGTATQAVFGTPIELNLGGRGIRSIDKGTDGNYLIIAGPAGGASSAVDRNFALFSWNGDPTANPVELDNDLEVLRKPTGGSFETIVDIPGAVAAGTSVQLLMDNGDTIFAGETEPAKDLDDAKQKYQGFRIKLGAPYVDNAGPVLKSSTPADDRAGTAVDAPIVLTFNEGVKLGAGNITLRKADGTAVESFNASSSPARAQAQFNVVTLKPTAKLAYSAGYYITIDANAIVDNSDNASAGITSATALNFTSAAPPTALVAGDVLFLGANAEAPDAFAFVLLKAVNGGTSITFTDRDRKADPLEFTGVTNESVFVWTADSDLPAGSIVTIQTDTDSSPIADKGVTVGAPGGLGKEETIYALSSATVAGLGEGTAGEITAVGNYLASITLGGAAGTIPAALTTAGTAFTFLPTGKSNQTNALYTGSLDRSNVGQFAALVKDPKNWTLTFNPAPGYPLTNGSLFDGK